MKQNERQWRFGAMPHAPHSASQAANCFQQVKHCDHNRLTPASHTGPATRPL